MDYREDRKGPTSFKQKQIDIETFRVRAERKFNDCYFTHLISSCNRHQKKLKSRIEKIEEEKEDTEMAVSDPKITLDNRATTSDGLICHMNQKLDEIISTNR